MSSTLIKTSLSIKSGKSLYTNSSIIDGVSDDDLVKFAEAYNSLQENTADKFIKKLVYLVTP